MSDRPNPGSPQAVDQGCTCPVIDNHHGAGFPFKGEIAFWKDARCTMHGTAPRGREE